MVFAVQRAALALEAAPVSRGRKCLHVFVGAAITNGILHMPVYQNAGQKFAISKVILDVTKGLAQMLIWAVFIRSQFHECEQV